MKSYKVRDIIMNIVLVALSISFLISLIILFREVKPERYLYSNDANSFFYALKEEEYSRMIEMTKENRAQDVEETSDLKECYAVSDFFEAAVMYQAYTKKGQPNMADECMKKMTEYQKDMGSLSYVTEKIYTKLGIE